MKRNTAEKLLQDMSHSKTTWLMGFDPVATGQQLRRMRRANDLTQEALSEVFELAGDSASRVTISNWENGRKVPTIFHLVFLAELYGCSLDELVLSYRRSRDAGDGDQPSPFPGRFRNIWNPPAGTGAQASGPCRVSLSRRLSNPRQPLAAGGVFVSGERRRARKGRGDFPGNAPLSGHGGGAGHGPERDGKWGAFWDHQAAGKAPPAAGALRKSGNVNRR